MTRVTKSMTADIFVAITLGRDVASDGETISLASDETETETCGKLRRYT